MQNKIKNCKSFSLLPHLPTKMTMGFVTSFDYSNFMFYNKKITFTI